MPQDATSSRELTSAGGGPGSTSTGFTTGTTCTSSGTYRASNKYMDAVVIVAAGEIFPPFVDGKKTTWFALTPNLSTNNNGGFTSVKVEAGTI